MGIRIHKTIGYTAKHSDKNALYNRLYETATDGEVAAVLTGLHDPFIDAPECVIYREDYEGKLKYPKTFSEIVHSCSGNDDEEFPEPYIIIPPSYMDKWYRIDDGIDYVEETLNGEPSVDRIRILNNPLYPFSGWMKSDGTKAPEFRSIEWYNNIDFIVPRVPESVRRIATHLGFNWIDLRPAIASW